MKSRLIIQFKLATQNNDFHWLKCKTQGITYIFIKNEKQNKRLKNKK